MFVVTSPTPPSPPRSLHLPLHLSPSQLRVHSLRVPSSRVSSWRVSSLGVPLVLQHCIAALFCIVLYCLALSCTFFCASGAPAQKHSTSKCNMKHHFGNSLEPLVCAVHLWNSRRCKLYEGGSEGVRRAREWVS